MRALEAVRCCEWHISRRLKVKNKHQEQTRIETVVWKRSKWPCCMDLHRDKPFLYIVVRWCAVPQQWVMQDRSVQNSRQHLCVASLAVCDFLFPTAFYLQYWKGTEDCLYFLLSQCASIDSSDSPQISHTSHISWVLIVALQVCRLWHFH